MEMKAEVEKCSFQVVNKTSRLKYGGKILFRSAFFRLTIKTVKELFMRGPDRADVDCKAGKMPSDGRKENKTKKKKNE